MLRFAELALEAGLPEDVLNVVVGGSTPVLLSSPIAVWTRSPSRVGPRPVANHGECSPQYHSGHPGTGGKSPNIVFSDADLGRAAAMAALVGTGLLSGQGCALPTRSYAHEDVYEQFLEKVVIAVASLVVGDPLDQGTYVGPVVTEAAADRIMAVITRAGKDGATLLTGGSRCGGEAFAGLLRGTDRLR